MILNPHHVIEQGWVSGINDKSQIQPNGIDYTADSAFTIQSHNPFYVGIDEKIMRGSNKLDVESGTWWIGSQQVNDSWRIQNGGTLDILSNMYVDLPEDVAAMLLPRSTLVRNGVFTSNGLYDSGFKGHLGSVIHNRCGQAYIERGASVGQIVFFVAEKVTEMYAGGYNHDEGTDLEYQE